MKSVTDGREYRIIPDEPWIIEDGALVLSLVKARKIRDLLNFDRQEFFESEPEDG